MKQPQNNQSENAELTEQQKAIIKEKDNQIAWLADLNARILKLVENLQKIEEVDATVQESEKLIDKFKNFWHVNH